jgi:hypothetical protein
MVIHPIATAMPVSFTTAAPSPASAATTPGSFRAALTRSGHAKASSTPPDRPPLGPAPSSSPARAVSSPAGHPARAALEAVERARLRLDSVLAAARRGQTFTAQELLALQADAYRYSQTLDVASKVVEQGVQSVKQAVNTQV